MPAPEHPAGQTSSDQTPLQRKLREYRERRMVVQPGSTGHIRHAEFPTPALPRIVERVAWYVLLGTVITFLVGLLPMLILEEDAIVLAREWRQLDALGRYAVGTVFLLAVLLVLPAMTATHWATASSRRAIEAWAGDHPDLVATPSQLKADPGESRGNLRVALYVFSGLFLVICGFLLVFGLISLAQDVPDSHEPVLIGLVGVVLGVACLFGGLALRGGAPARSPRKTWTDDIAQAAREAKRAAQQQELLALPAGVRAWRSAATALAAVQYGLISLTTLFAVLGVYARQPCRTCEPRVFGPGVEATMDQFWLGVGVLALLAAVAIIGNGLVHILASQLTRRELLRRIEAGLADRARPEDKVLLSMLDEQSGPWSHTATLLSLWMMAPLLVGAVWLLVGRVGHTSYADHAGIGQGLLLGGVVLLVVFVVCTAVDEIGDPAIRDRIRQAWPVAGTRRRPGAPGDD